MPTAAQLRNAGVYVPAHVRDHEDVPLGVPMTEQDVSRVAHKILSILPDMERLPQLSTDLAGVMRLLGCKSRSAAYRELAALGVAPYVTGKYRIRDIENAVARRSINAAKQAKESREKKQQPEPVAA